MSLSKEIEKLRFDKRLTDWQVSRGRMSKAELKQHLDALPDLASNVETLRLNEESAGGQAGHGHHAGTGSATGSNGVDPAVQGLN